nr:RNA:RNP complex 1 interacting phosphatase [Hymenolepis microstoma]
MGEIYFIASSHSSDLPKFIALSRWLDYAPFGLPIDGTPLLPIKLPIPKELSQNIPRKYWFTDNDLLNYCLDQNRPLTALVDLTFTTYYDPRLFTDRDVHYKKIFIEGHVIPGENAVNQFIKQVKNLAEQSPDGLIAVHCTHGINRTGYLICRYLIDVLGWSPNRALAEFEKARGYAIERDNYVADLLSR